MLLAQVEHMFRFATWYKNRVRRLAKDKSGVTAIEFAMVAPVFFFLVFAIIETALLYFTATVMNGEVASTARAIRTGSLQQLDDPEDAFYEALCSNLGHVLDCSKVIVDVRTFANFDDLTFDPYLDEEGEADGAEFDPGAAGEVVLIRIAYKYNIITPYLAEFLAPDGTGRVMLQAAAAFQNEPFQNLF